MEEKNVSLASGPWSMGLTSLELMASNLSKCEPARGAGYISPGILTATLPELADREKLWPRILALPSFSTKLV